jgi:hypothetical protein
MARLAAPGADPLPFADGVVILPQPSVIGGFVVGLDTPPLTPVTVFACALAADAANKKIKNAFFIARPLFCQIAYTPIGRPEKDS